MNEWIIRYVKKEKFRFLLTIFFGLLGIGSAAMLLFVSGYLISTSSLRPENIMAVYVPIVSVRAFSIGQALFPYVQQLISHDVVLRILSTYRKKVYTLVERQLFITSHLFNTGDLLRVVSDDIEELQHFYLRTLYPSAIGLVVYGVLMLVLGYFNVLFMLFMLALLGVIVFLIPITSFFVMRKNLVKTNEEKGILYRYITDALFGLHDWRLSNQVDKVKANIAIHNKQLVKKQHYLLSWHYIRDAFLRLLTGVAIIAMMIWANYAVAEEAISPTVIAAFVLMMFSITDALLPISDAVEKAPHYMDSIKRLERIQSLAPSNKKSTQRIERLVNPTIRIENITFRYGNDEPNVVDNVSFTVEYGKKIALLGRSGSGKSTLLTLLAGLIQPTKGEIYMNNEKAQEQMLGATIGVLNQSPHLFHTTIANNLRIGRKDSTDEEIIDVLKQVQLYDLVKTLPDGIHTQMEEMGKRFSGGEKQRIAFARVLLQDTPILLLDEPTTGLDVRTEWSLLKTIFEVAEEKTIILVTHHLTSASFVDELIFLKDGKITMRGSHESLYETEEYYRTLYAMDHIQFQNAAN